MSLLTSILTRISFKEKVTPQHAFPQFVPNEIKRFPESLVSNLEKEYQCSKYHISVLEYLDINFGLKGKTVIDVGGSNIPKSVADYFGIKTFICIDPISKWVTGFHGVPLEETRYAKEKIIKKESIMDAISTSSHFIVDEEIEDIQHTDIADFIISISTFEHVNSLKKTYSSLFTLLKSKGILFSTFEPIYSSPAGHHIYINDQLNFQITRWLDYVHLLKNKEEINDLFQENKVSEENAEKIIDQLHTSNFINRKSLNDHIISMANSPFNAYFLNYWHRTEIPNEVYNTLVKKFGEMRFDVRGLSLLAFKE